MSPFLIGTDVVVLTPRGDPIALVETKNREDLSREVAMILRRNLVAHGLAKRAPYFLLVSQDRGFLWDERSGGKLLAAPVAEFSMVPVIQRYLPQVGPEDRLRGAQLDLVVAQWLNDLAFGEPDPRGEPERSLVPTGFLTGIRGGTVHADVAA
jgi:hypothetical protein